MRSPTPDPDGPMAIENLLREERDAYDTLVQDGCQPSHPIDLGFKVLDYPGKYSDIVSYWQQEERRRLFRAQLFHWNKFRNFQQQIRQYHIPRSSFPEYQQKICERRQKNELEGDVELCQERGQQSRLVNWIEYQDYNHRLADHLKQDIEAAQHKLDSILLERGSLMRLEPPSLGLALELSSKERAAWEKTKLAKINLSSMEQRLKSTDVVNANVGAEANVATLNQEMILARKELDESRQLYEEAKSAGRLFGAQNDLLYVAVCSFH